MRHRPNPITSATCDASTNPGGGWGLGFTAQALSQYLYGQLQATNVLDTFCLPGQESARDYP